MLRKRDKSVKMRPSILHTSYTLRRNAIFHLAPLKGKSSSPFGEKPSNFKHKD